MTIQIPTLDFLAILPQLVLVGMALLLTLPLPITVSLLGELPLATAALFDLGVYITVVASTLLTLSVLGGASKEGQRR